MPYLDIYYSHKPPAISLSAILYSMPDLLKQNVSSAFITLVISMYLFGTVDSNILACG